MLYRLGTLRNSCGSHSGVAGDVTYGILRRAYWLIQVAADVWKDRNAFIFRIRQTLIS